MIDWCSVNGALQKTLSVPGPVTVPLAAVPGPGPEEHCMHVICNLARLGGAEGGTWIWIYKMLLVSPRRLWVGVRMSASLCHVSGVTHVSHHFASQRKCRDCAPMFPSRHWQLVSPGSSASASPHLAILALGRQIGSMTDDGSSSLSSQ